jgi:thiamine transport system substrate-binding protein
MPFRILLLIAILLTALMGSAAQSEEPVVLTLLTHDSFSVSEAVLAQFEAETNISVEILRAGDAGTLVNQAVLTAGNPLGDVLFGVDNTFLSRALNGNIFIPYQSALVDVVDEQFVLDPEFRVTPIDYGDVCLNYDIQYFEERGLDVPDDLLDLIQPEYAGLLAAQNPATSSPGLAFLLTTIAQFGTPADDSDDYNYLNYWEDLVANGALVVDDWSTAYFEYFTQGGANGSYPLVVSYASSPPFTFSEESGTAATASITTAGTCFRQIEFAGILQGTAHEAEAQQLIDFMLGEAFQSDLPMQMYVFPVNPEVELPEVFAEYAQIPAEPAAVAYDAIEMNRELWVTDWLETVFQ